MSRLYLGIDPGMTGAIACLDDRGGIVFAERTPLIEGEYDENAMSALVDCLVDGEDTGAFCVIEQVGAFPGMGVSGAFGFGEGFGLWRGMLVAHGIPYAKLLPRRWQKEACLSIPAKAPALVGATAKQIGQAKAARTREVKGSIVADALRRWPEASKLLKLKADWGIADALWMAEVARKRAETA